MDIQTLYKNSNPADEILPGLLLGNRVAAGDETLFKREHIRTVFNCTKDIPFHPTISRQYRVAVDDSRQEEDINKLDKWSFEIVYKLAHEVRRSNTEGSGILVHCAAGMQRSAAVVAMYLIAMKNMTTDEAITFIQSKRPIAFRPEANFEKSIRNFETTFNRDIRPKLNTK
jgi:hypothetical protein